MSVQVCIIIDKNYLIGNSTFYIFDNDLTISEIIDQGHDST